MKNKNQGTVIVSVLFAVLCLAQTASAFYAPNLQRWVNRDPILERGGFNLYRFAANSPVGKVDFLGLFGDANACAMAQAMGLDATDGDKDIGGVICNGQKKIPCVWQPSATGISNPKAQDASIRCIWKHEDTHKPDGDCPDGCGISRLRLRKGADENQSECRAYDVHVDCLVKALFEDNVCGDDLQCNAQLQRELDRVSDQRARFCGRTGGK